MSMIGPLLLGDV